MGLWLDRGRECDNLHQAIEIQIIHYLCGTDSPVSVALNTPLDRPIDRALRGFFIRFCYPSVTRPPKWRLLVTNKPIYHSELQPILERSNRFCIGKYNPASQHPANKLTLSEITSISTSPPPQKKSAFPVSGRPIFIKRQSTNSPLFPPHPHQVSSPAQSGYSTRKAGRAAGKQPSA